MMLIAVCMLLLLPLSFAQNDVQATPASADYQAGLAKGLDLGSVMFRLQGAAPYNSEAASLFNQKIWEFNLALDNAFGQGSNLSRLYRLQPYGSDKNITANTNANNIIPNNVTHNNMTPNNTTHNNTMPNNMTPNNMKPSNEIYNNTNAIINAANVVTNVTANIAANKTEPIVAKEMPLKSSSFENETMGNSTEENQTAVLARALENYTIRAGNKSSKVEDVSTQELRGNITLNVTNLSDDKSMREVDAIFRDTLRNPEIPLEPMVGMPGPEKM